MTAIVSWRLEGDKIILSITGEKESEQFDIELPNDIYGEIIRDGPPSEDKQIRSLIDQIHEIRKKRITAIDKVIELEDELLKEVEEARKELKAANDKHEIAKWKAVLDSVTKSKTILQERRYLIKLLYQEEGKLSLKLHRKSIRS